MQGNVHNCLSLQAGCLTAVVYLCKNIQSFIRRRNLAMTPHRSSIANSELEMSFPHTIRCVDDYFLQSVSMRSETTKDTSVVTSTMQYTTTAVMETDTPTVPTTLKVTEVVVKTTEAPKENTQSETNNVHNFDTVKITQ